MNEINAAFDGEKRIPGIEELITELASLRDEVLTFAEEHSSHIAEAHSSFQPSALNLLHYLAMRRRDLRPLQKKLSAIGLSSLGGIESNVLFSINAALIVLHQLARKPFEIPLSEKTADFEAGHRILAEHTEKLLGNAPTGRNVRIMVTMPSRAASDYELVYDLLERGMNVARINCAHDDAATWLRMIENLRRAETSLGVSCKVLMDLAGPKLRTGPLEESDDTPEMDSANASETEMPGHVRTPAQEAVSDPEPSITLQKGDHLIITRDEEPGHAAVYNAGGEVLTPAIIGCTLPEVFDDARVGQSIWFDDGEIGGVIEEIESERVLVRITHAQPRGGKLRGDKGINLPESDLELRALTEKDFEDLPFIVEHADMVAMSFVSSAEDVEILRKQMKALGKKQPAIVLKIETRKGFENLPQILLAAMKTPSCGVMIARGDLAVEVGFERLAEVQEEILWVCEAAHVPVVWATQVLESLAKKGLPSRAEITDAAMGHRAECVMLNKGEHIRDAVEMLDDILRRMQNHQSKKMPMLRGLSLARADLNADG